MKQSFSTVREVLENYKTSIFERDVEKFLCSYSENINLYDCWGKWDCNGLWDWRKSVESWFQELSEEGESVAFAKCAITFSAYAHHRLKNFAKSQIDLRLDCASWTILFTN